MARKKKQEDSGAGSPWMQTFSDLMNLLLCFFVLLFASSSPDAEKYAQIVASFSNNFNILQGGGTGIGDGSLVSAGASQLNNLDQYIQDMGKSNESSESPDADPLKEFEKQQEKITDEMYNKMMELAEQYNVEQYVTISKDANNQFIQISMSGAILFDSNQADIKNDAKPILDKVGQVLKRFDKYQIVVEGHTDNQQIHKGQYKNNLWLSTARACTVYEYLINNTKGLSPETMESSGRSEYEPVADNSTPEGRAKNRRVEIKIYNELSNK